MREQLLEIQVFRTQLYKKYCSHLLNECGELDHHEKLIDKRSWHVLAYKNGQLYGVLRMTPYSFCSINSLSKEADQDTEYMHNYYEFNRLVTLRSDKILNRLIVLVGASYAYLKLNAEGLIGMTRLKLKKNFLQYGLVQIGESFTLTNKANVKYAIIAGSFENIAVESLKYFLGLKKKAPPK